MKASISDWAVTHTGQPGPERREIVSGRSDRIPLLKIDTVWVPQTSISLIFRVLIRRIFDEWTPPSLGLVIDGSLGTVDWEAEGVRLGKAVYRSLQPGRWTVSVSGAGLASGIGKKSIT